MTTTDMMNYPLWVLIAGAVVLLSVMFLARQQAHQLILRLARALHSQLRLMSRACLFAAQRIRLRNHEVIKALAEALLERQLERRFLRIEKLVERDLNSYQQLAAEINAHLANMDEDYAASTQVPEVSPEWISAVDAMVNLQANKHNSEVIGKILDDMHQTVQEHQRDALREHRWTVSSRHKILAGLQPKWRRLAKLLQQIDSNIGLLRQRLRQVDQQMGQFEMLTAGSGQGIMASMLMRFVSSLCFVLVGAGAVWINWHLLYGPLQTLLPATQSDLPLPAMIAALHIATTLVAATMISESLRITHLFPLVTAMTRKGRQGMVAVGSCLLIILTALEMVAMAGVPVTAASVESLFNVPQMLMILLGMMLPVMLSLTVIPLEYMLHTVRPVIGTLLQLVLHVITLVLRLVASLVLHLGTFLVHAYDLLICVPLHIEREWRVRRDASAEQAKPSGAAPEADSDNVTALRLSVDNRQ